MPDDSIILDLADSDSLAQDKAAILDELDTLPDPAQQRKDAIHRVQQRLAECTQEQLLDQYRSCFFGSKTVKLKVLFYISQELTKRGIPPIFRASASRYRTMIESGARDVETALLLIDLEWITGRHPDHVPRYAKFKHVFDKKHRTTPEALMARVRFLQYLENPRTPDLIASASMLKLSGQQQRECCVLRTLNVGRWIDRVHEQEPEIREMIRESVMNDAHDRRSADKKANTIAVRQDLWLCAHIAGWDNPQQVAKLYEARTGSKIDRGTVGRHLAKMPERPRDAM
ncbi:MAG: hypothetical protein H6R07_3259 [Proteobacteria bacterium]|nr:hypothetical protein [Pseudomonadota bacterium]